MEFFQRALQSSHKKESNSQENLGIIIKETGQAIY